MEINRRSFVAVALAGVVLLGTAATVGADEAAAPSGSDVVKLTLDVKGMT